MPLQTRFAAQLPGGGTIYTGLPLYPTTTFAVAGDVFFAGFGHEGRVRRFSSAGDTLADLSWTAPVEPLTADRRAAWQQPILESVKGRAEEPHMQSYLDALPYPDALPAYDRLLGDDTGKLWVRSYPVPGADSTLWRVLESDGTVVARITTPATLQLLHVGVEFIVASDTDVDGQERVAVWRLRR
jgi:hypothetical protein